MYDEILCDAPLPDGFEAAGVRFQTKSFPSPCLQRYRITAGGRLIDTPGNDLEPDGHIIFYTSDADSTWREYRARFLSGQLGEIVRVSADEDDRIRYGLTSYRWFSAPSFLFDDDAEESGGVQDAQTSA